ncbi:Hsp90 co-chaperone CDC37 [Ramicandelaber brevisporus]|nr:Hsp90 co-chaperone CDC37 [Ramicandelaber brevisporus]
MEKQKKAVENNEMFMERPTLDEMMAMLIFRIQDDLVKSGKVNPETQQLSVEQATASAVEAGGGARPMRDAFIKVLDEHTEKLKKRELERVKELAKLEKEEAMTLTSENISKPGFDSSRVAPKGATSATATSSSSSAAAKPKAAVKSSTPASATVELLNPSFTKVSLDEKSAAVSAAAPPNKSVWTDTEEEKGRLDVSSEATQFSELVDLEECKKFISRHPHIASMRYSDEVMALGLRAEQAGKHADAKRCIRQAKMLAYSAQLGGINGVGVFFGRVMAGDANSPARRMFDQDVDDTYAKIRQSVHEMAAEDAIGPHLETGTGDDRTVSSIQLQSDDPNAKLDVVIPDEADQSPENQLRLVAWSKLSKKFQEALKIGTVAAVNEAFAEMAGDQAEEALQLCEEAGFIQLSGTYEVDGDEQTFHPSS